LDRGTQAETSQASLTTTASSLDYKGTPWMVNPPFIFLPIITTCGGLSSTYNSH